MNFQNTKRKTAELPDGTEYVIRPFEPGDESDVCRLYEQIRTEAPSPRWLDWKFRENPYSTGVSMFVAEGPDGIIGIHPFVPLRIRSGSTTVDGVCFVNLLVRSDYQGKGVFSTLTDRAVTYHRSRSDLLFCFANENSTPIYEHWGWNAVRDEVTHFRFNNPGAIAGKVHDALELVSKPFSTTRLHLYPFDYFAPSYEDIEVRRFTDVPAQRLGRLYQQNIPEKIHVVRDESYYRWRLGDPEQKWETYIATRGTEDIGAFIIRYRNPSPEYTRVDVEDAIFLANDQTKYDAATALFTELISDSKACDLIAVPDTLLPRDLLQKRGFVATDWPLFSEMYARSFSCLTLFAKPVSDVEIDISDPENWIVSSLIRTTN